MAKDDELELDTAKSGGGKGKLIVIIIVVVLLTAGGVIAGLYFTGMLGGGAKDAAETEGSDDEKKELAIKPAFYKDLDPAFVVNFEDQSQAAYLQIEMQVMAHDKLVLDEVAKHMPVIRNNILLILSAQKFEVVKTRQGKEALQKTVLEAIQAVLEEAYNATPEDERPEGGMKNVEQVYFTSFIMQ